MAKKSKKKEDEPKKVVAKCDTPNEVVAICDHPEEVIANCESPQLAVSNRTNWKSQFVTSNLSTNGGMLGESRDGSLIR